MELMRLDKFLVSQNIATRKEAGILARKGEITVDGAVVKAGKAVGVQTPLCEKVVEITHGIENGLYEISYKNIDFFE